MGKRGRKGDGKNKIASTMFHYHRYHHLLSHDSKHQE